MIYQKAKNIVVEDKKLMTEKKFSKFTRRLMFFALGLFMDLGLIAYAVSNMATVIAMGVICILLFSWMLDYAVEDETTLKRINIFTKFFWLFYLIFVAEFIVLNMTNFI